MEISKNHAGWIVISIILFATVITIVSFVIILKNPDTNRWSPEIILSSLLVFGVIALIVSLTFIAVIFKSLELTDARETLGLPEGSIRAVIALSLILIFMISSVFLYYQIQINDSKESIYRDITQDQINDIPKDEIISIIRINETRFTVTRLVDTGSETAEDVAKQIITTVSTLVVAVAGFYFGTRAVTVAQGSGQVTSDPVIRSINKNEGKRDEEILLEISGKNFDSPKVRLLQEPNKIEVPDDDITSSSTKIRCTLKIPPKSDNYPDGKWTVVVINSDNREDKLNDAFTIS